MKKSRKGTDKPIVEPGFHVQRLTNARRHTRAVHDDLPQPGVGGRQDGRQDSGFPERQRLETPAERDCSQHDGEQHAGAQQSNRQVLDAPQMREVGTGWRR